MFLVLFRTREIKNGRLLSSVGGGRRRNKTERFVTLFTCLRRFVAGSCNICRRRGDAGARLISCQLHNMTVYFLQGQHLRGQGQDQGQCLWGPVRSVGLGLGLVLEVGFGYCSIILIMLQRLIL